MSTITHLALSNVKKNKTRSILVVMSILLTTMLLTIVASLGTAMLKHGQVNAGKLYGDFFGTYSKVSEEQLKNMELQSAFIDIGKQAYVATVENRDADMHLYWVDAQAQKSYNIQDRIESGYMPKKGNEIAAQIEFFQKQGVKNPKEGDQVQISLRSDNQSKYQVKTFTISGILSSSEMSNLKSAYIAYVSQEFFENQIPKEQHGYTVSFKLNDSIKINTDNGEMVLKELGEKCGIDKRNVSDNYIYLMYTKNPGTETILGCVMISLLVIVVSVAVIYNIFQVGIVQKIQEYGKIKALGTTRKQMKAMIFREGMMMALIGIPAGILVGTGVSALIFHGFVEKGRTNMSGMQNIEQVSVISLSVWLLIAVVSVLTVWIALKKPMKIVASVSPVEAVRYNENTNRKISTRKGRKKISVVGMTLANLSANRRRTVGTICTMGLSCVLFVALSNLAGNIDNEYEARKAVEYGRFVLHLNYSLNDEAYPEKNLENICKQNPLGEELQEKIHQIDGITEIIQRNIIAVKEQKQDVEIPRSVIILNKKMFQKYAEEEGVIGKLDYNTVTIENGLVYAWSYFMEENGYHQGQEVKLELQDGDKTVNYCGKIQGSFAAVSADWIITEDTWKNLGLSESTTGSIWLDCEEKEEEKVEKALKELLAGMDHVELIAYKNSIKEVELGTKMMQSGVYGMLVILGCIGFLNMANTIITGVITRKRELGVLQAVGMTNRQMNQMLQLEGIFFSAGTILVSLMIGQPLGYILFQYCKSYSFYGLNEYHVPVMEITIMILVIVLLQSVLSFLLSRNLRKESLVERINYQG